MLSHKCTNGNDSTFQHRALVFGATGYTGNYLVKRLTERGIETYAHIRPGSSKASSQAPVFEEFGAKVSLEDWNEEGIRELVRSVQPTLVFAVLGTTRSRMKVLRKNGGSAHSGSYEAVDYGLTAMIHRACEAMEDSPRFIYLSSMGVKAGTRMPYLAVRWRMEQELRDGKSPWTIVRPGFITGSDREEFRFGERAGAMVSDGLLALTGWMGGHRTRQKYRSITGDELAKGMIRWALSKDGCNKVITTVDLWENS